MKLVQVLFIYMHMCMNSGIDKLTPVFIPRLIKKLNECKTGLQNLYKKFAGFVTELKLELKDGSRTGDQLIQFLERISGWGQAGMRSLVPAFFFLYMYTCH